MRRHVRTMVLAIAATTIAAHAGAADRTPASVDSLLDSIGVNTSLQNRGQTLEGTIAMLRYAGIRWIRVGVEDPGGSDDPHRPNPSNTDTIVEIHRRLGVRASWGLLSGGSDVERLLSTGRILASKGALLAFEGANEPNNWPVTVDGARGGGKDGPWGAVATLQSRLYEAVKADPKLRRFPVWNVSEAGAETSDVGLQWLEVPQGSASSTRAGTRFADAANLHNYPTGVNRDPLPDNVAWDASDPTAAVAADGLFHEYGITWNGHHKGYEQAALDRLPRVSTETGVLIQGSIDERRQAALLLDIYLAQFARGYSHTAIYLLRDRTDEAGNQAMGLFRPDYTPRLAATDLHALTTILGGMHGRPGPDRIVYEIPGRPPTVHDIPVRTRTGTLGAVLWGERSAGEDHIQVRFSGRFDVTVRDPTRGVDPVERLTGVEVLPIALSDHPVVLTIEPSR